MVQWCAQLYDQDIAAVKFDFGETAVHQIDAMTVQFPAKFSCGTAKRVEDAQYIKYKEPKYARQ
jgi:hypothetical protein